MSSCRWIYRDVSRFLKPWLLWVTALLVLLLHMCNTCISYGAPNIMHAMGLETAARVPGVPIAGYTGMFAAVLSPGYCRLLHCEH